MLPYLIVAYDLNYTLAATVMLANSVVSAVVQPLFGYLGDRVNRPWLMSVGIMFSALGITAMGFVGSYPLVLVCALVVGIGVALFHPEGAKLANVVAGERKGRGVSNFSVGGNIGFGFGPVIAVFAISTFGMQGTIIFLIPGTIAALILLSQVKTFRRLTAVEQQRIAESPAQTLNDDWIGFSKITLVNTCRAIIGNAFITFIPLYWVFVLGQSHEVGALMITINGAVGAVATLTGGRLADRIGIKRMIMISLVLLAPLTLLFLFTSNVIVATAIIVACFMAFSLAFAPGIVLCQSYLPNRLGFASGISLGVVVSIGGIASPGLGRIGDLWGLSTTFGVVCALTFLALGLACTLYLGRNAHDGIGEISKQQDNNTESTSTDS